MPPRPILGPFWGHSGTIFNAIVKEFWDASWSNFDAMLEPFCDACRGIQARSRSILQDIQVPCEIFSNKPVASKTFQVIPKQAAQDLPLQLQSEKPPRAHTSTCQSRPREGGRRCHAAWRPRLNSPGLWPRACSDLLSPGVGCCFLPGNLG